MEVIWKFLSYTERGKGALLDEIECKNVAERVGEFCGASIDKRVDGKKVSKKREDEG